MSCSKQSPIHVGLWRSVPNGQWIPSVRDTKQNPKQTNSEIFTGGTGGRPAGRSRRCSHRWARGRPRCAEPCHTGQDDPAPGLLCDDPGAWKSSQIITTYSCVIFDALANSSWRQVVPTVRHTPCHSSSKEGIRFSVGIIWSPRWFLLNSHHLKTWSKSHTSQY